MICSFEGCQHEGIVRPVFKIWALRTPFHERDASNCFMAIPNLPLCREHFALLKPEGNLALGIFAQAKKACAAAGRAPLDPDHIAIDCQHVLPNAPVARSTEP